MVEVPWLVERYERGDFTVTGLSKLAGYGSNTSNINRVLKNGRCKYATAVKLVRALGIDPVDVGV